MDREKAKGYDSRYIFVAFAYEKHYMSL